MSNGLIVGVDGKSRCFWHDNKPDYELYHDVEWGRPNADDFQLFEKICLEGFQSGLSWLTILRKRDNFRETFANFDFNIVATFGEKQVEKLLQDQGIVRHQGKIRSTINNAQRTCELVQEFGSLAQFLWSFEPLEANRPTRIDYNTLMNLAKTEESIKLSKELKNRGWSFVGPTTMYAFMQATGFVNDHIEGCWVREQVEEERKNFARPNRI